MGIKCFYSWRLAARSSGGRSIGYGKEAVYEGGMSEGIAGRSVDGGGLDGL